MISSILNEIMIYRKELTKDFDLLFSRGLSDDEISFLCKENKIKLNDEFKEIFKWKNGYIHHQEMNIGDYYLIPGFTIIPIEQSIKDHLLYYGINKKWKFMYPILLDFGGGYYCYNNNDKAIYNIIVDEGSVNKVFNNINNMLLYILESFKEKGFFISEDGYLEQNNIIIQKIALKHSDLQYWKDYL